MLNGGGGGGGPDKTPKASWKIWEGFLEEVTAVYDLKNDEGSARPLSYFADESVHQYPGFGGGEWGEKLGRKMIYRYNQLTLGCPGVSPIHAGACLTLFKEALK